MTIQLGGAEVVVEPPPAVIELVVETPFLPAFEVESPASPSVEIMPVPGAPGADGADYDSLPDLTLLFENGLI